MIPQGTPPITGTFLDGTAGDIPAQNWGAGEWTAQFDVFKKMGMDTLIIIRCVTSQRAIYPTRVADVPLVYNDIPKGCSDLAEVCKRFDVDFWANVETFDRDMPWRFPPIDWVKLRHKIETQRPYVSKMITFEAPHFLSPISMFPSARCLYDRYGEKYLGWKVPPRIPG